MKQPLSPSGNAARWTWQSMSDLVGFMVGRHTERDLSPESHHEMKGVPLQCASRRAGRAFRFQEPVTRQP